MVSQSELGTKDQKIEHFRHLFSDYSDDQLLLEIAKYGDDSPVAERIAASLILSQRKQDMEAKTLAAAERANNLEAQKQASEIKQWWLRPPGLIAIAVISNLLTAAVFYLLGRAG
jgi:hypothetical protein